MNIDTFNDRIEDLWHEYKGKYKLTISPLLYSEPEKGGMLSIGINPSFIDKGIAKREKYDFANIKQNKKAIITGHEDTVKHYKFFAPYRKISRKLHLLYAHIDLFYYRSSQNELKKVIFDNKRLNNFAYKQLKISQHIINYINPRIIVVINALARDILKGKKGDVSSTIQVGEFNETYGTYLIKIAGKEYSTFFTGYMSIDEGTLERLQWHIKYVLKGDHGA
jgi:hypothetical protein